MNELKSRYLNYLASKININGKARNNSSSQIHCEETLESIIEHLEYLGERMNSEDNKLYIPLPIKRILLWLLTDGNYSLNVSIKEFKPNEYVVATAIVTVNGNTTSVDYMSILDAVAAFGITDAERNKQMVNSAMGSAVTRAITQSGIGLDIIGDIEDDVQTSSPENQTMEATDQTVKLDKEADKLSEILSGDILPATADDNAAPAPAYDPDAYKNIVAPFGSYKDKLLKDCPDKIAGWIQALVDTQQITVTDEQYTGLTAFVKSNEAAKKQYDACMAKKR